VLSFALVERLSQRGAREHEEASVDCLACHTPLPERARFCLSCGAPVKPSGEAASDPLRVALESAIGFQYRLERLLGRGGMGAVYLAHELALDRPVAIKVLPPDRSDPALRERFKREARTAARLTHSGIVPLHTFGEVKGLMYFVMGYVEGESLAARLSRVGRLDAAESRRILRELAEALDYAHRQGVVHRDVKPDNVLVEKGTGRVVLADFGIARAAQTSEQLTGTGHVVGTPHYMSPEQAAGKRDVDGRSDLYSLGVMGYAMLAGRLPFEGTTAAEVLVKHLTQVPPPLTTVVPGAPAQLVSAVERCLAKQPARRWADAGSLARTLASGEEEGQEALEEVSLLRLGVLGLVAALPVRLYTALLYGAAPDWDVVTGVELARAFGILGAGLVVVSTLALRYRRRRAWRFVLHAAFEQPRWWGAWYPRAFRRPGDVWHRLPRHIRLFNTAVGLTAAVFLFLSMPLPLLLAAAHGYRGRTGEWSVLGGSLNALASHPVGRALVMGLFLLPFVALLAEVVDSVLYGRRLIKKLGPALPDPEQAKRALFTPSWQRSFWERPPFDSLLLPEAAPSPAATLSEGTTQAALPDAMTVTHTPDELTRER